MPPPTNTPGIYPRTRYQRLTGVPGLPTEPKGPRPPYSREQAWPPQKPGILAVFIFFTHLSDIHGPATVWIPEHTPGPALHEAGTCAHPPRPQFSGPRIIANTTAPRPGNSVSMGHAHAAPPISTGPWDILKNMAPTPDRGSGAVHRVQGLPAPLQQGAWPPQKPPEFWLFFPLILRISVTCTAPPLPGSQGVHPGRH